jgi:BMFP domain-containing protein YqiC
MDRYGRIGHCRCPASQVKPRRCAATPLRTSALRPIVNAIRPGRSEIAMVQTTNRLFDELARLMNDAAGVASGVRREFETLVRTQAERILRDLDVVKREEFEAVKEMAQLAREENEALKARIEALEARGRGAEEAGTVPPTAPP